jgi:release factor glutamine methyltransferase
MYASGQEKKEMLWTIREVLNWTTKRFLESGIDTPLLDTQLLLCRVLNLKKIQLYTEIDKPLTGNERFEFRELVKKRLKGEPVAYLLNEKYWHELKLYLDKRVLIPRPETESMLDFVLQNYKLKNKEPFVIFDFCTGSGCLAIALAKKFPTAKVVGIDFSQDSLDVANKNAELNYVTNVKWINANIINPEIYFTLLSEYKKADIIVANPPYISENEWDQLEVTVKNFEPKIALVSEENGLKIGKKIFQNICEFQLLNSDGIFAMEMAEKQPQKICSEVHKMIQMNHPVWLSPKNEWFALCDFEGKDRFLVRIQENEVVSLQE